MGGKRMLESAGGGSILGAALFSPLSLGCEFALVLLKEFLCSKDVWC